MNELVPARARPTEHCGAIRHVRVKRVLPDALRAPLAGRNHTQHKNQIRLYVGEVVASQLPVVLDTLLGSCVAVCLYDPVLRAGGMNHILLPNCRAGEKSARCGVHAMELLINELMKLGGDRRRFIAKAFGGANVLQGLRLPPVGDKNAEFVREFLATERMPLVAERLGGNHAVHVYFRTDTSKATVQTVDGSRLPNIIDAEQSYGDTDSTDEFIFGETTLF
jgi:chemotaxis protein CheD